MKASGESGAPGLALGSIRIDRLLVYLRFARTRSAAQAMIEAHALRRNRKHVLRGAEPARIGDILTIALGDRMQVIELLTLPARRGPPTFARSHYREVDDAGLDPKEQMTLAASPLRVDHLPDASQDRF
jgi:ribosome-associated heat shock protein Hsp15